MHLYKTKVWFYTSLVFNTEVRFFRGLQLAENTGNPATR